MNTRGLPRHCFTTEKPTQPRRCKTWIKLNILLSHKVSTAANMPKSADSEGENCLAAKLRWLDSIWPDGPTFVAGPKYVIMHKCRFQISNIWLFLIKIEICNLKHLSGALTGRQLAYTLAIYDYYIYIYRVERLVNTYEALLNSGEIGCDFLRLWLILVRSGGVMRCLKQKLLAWLKKTQSHPYMYVNTSIQIIEPARWLYNVCSTTTLITGVGISCLTNQHNYKKYIQEIILEI